MTGRPALSPSSAESPVQDEPAVSARDAVEGRRSIRRFLPTEVPLHLVKAILNGAARAPSGTNSQPWRVHVATGGARERVTTAVLAAAEAGQRSDEYAYMPSPLREPYLSRRRQIGYELYRLYGIDRQDFAARKAAALRNYAFFGAPVGLFFTLDHDLLHGSWLDCGMFMQNVMTLARAYGLETCPQQAWCDYGPVVHRELGIPDDQIILAGMALGYADTSAPENALVSPRIGDAEFAVYHTD